MLFSPFTWEDPKLVNEHYRQGCDDTNRNTYKIVMAVAKQLIKDCKKKTIEERSGWTATTFTHHECNCEFCEWNSNK